jgi:hypothetical protein
MHTTPDGTVVMCSREEGPGCLRLRSSLRLSRICKAGLTRSSEEPHQRMSRGLAVQEMRRKPLAIAEEVRSVTSREYLGFA